MIFLQEIKSSLFNSGEPTFVYLLIRICNALGMALLETRTR